MPVTVSIDGELVAPEAAVVSVFDRGLLYGDGLFEVLRTWGGRAVDLDAHLERLYASARALQLQAMPRERLAEAVHDAVHAAASAPGPSEHRIRIVLTRGPGALGVRLGALGPGRAIAIVEPLLPRPRELSLAVVELPLPRRRAAGHKTLAYLEHVLARELAAAAGADEAVRLDADGLVAEGATSNVFAIAGGVLATPPVDGGALPGVTRGHVLACARTLGIPGGPHPIAREALAAADELFVTSAVRGVVAVTNLDGVARATGPVTARISAAYDAVFQQQ